MISEKVVKSARRVAWITLALGMFLVIGVMSFWIQGPELAFRMAKAHSSHRPEVYFFAMMFLGAAVLIPGMMLWNRGEIDVKILDRIAENIRKGRRP